MENDKAFASQQLICMLPPLALKVMCYLLNWQKIDVIKYYENQMCKFLHITKEELQLGIQTLLDNNLIDVSRSDNQWCIQVNKKTVNSYFNVKMDKVAEHEGFQLSKEITWNKEDGKRSTDAPDSIESMSEQQLKKLLLRIESSLNERQQLQKIVVQPTRSRETNYDVDSLPF